MPTQTVDMARYVSFGSGLRIGAGELCMNYFAHGRRFIDDPYFLAGTAVPDWLSVSDRAVRARSKAAAPWCDNADERVAAVARGIVQHHHDDSWFHNTRDFAELSLQLTVLIRDELADRDGLRPSFLGHILVELLLDAALIDQQPDRLEGYYAAMDGLDPHAVALAVGQIAPKRPERLAEFIVLFCRERFLWDYRDDGKLVLRLNQVMRRVNLPPLTTDIYRVLPVARDWVNARFVQLLSPPHPVFTDRQSAAEGVV